MTHDAIDAALFKVGDRVQKRSGYRFPGIVRSVYPKGDGEIRYDVEADHPAFAGMLHIFSEAQLEPREALVPAGESVAGAARDMREALEKLIAACDNGRRFERGVGGMTIEAQIRRTVINGVSAWAVEEAREALHALPLPAPQPQGAAEND